jgi:hypothetical protein
MIAKVKEKKVDEVSSVRDMFENGTVSGELKTMYSMHDIDNQVNPYATAIGGVLKYELAELKGFNAGVAFSTSHDINSLSGNEEKYNRNMSSSDGSYTELTEAYINYKYKDLNLRGGRQIVDTPLADSDDIRIIANTFEAYIATFEFNRWTFTAGKLQQWQGTDAGLDGDWQNTGDDGTYFGGITLSKVLLDVNLWYYHFSEDSDVDSATGNISNQTTYVDFSLHNKFGDDFLLHSNIQYLHQDEADNSGIESNIYGALVEFVAYDLGISVAYNQSQKKEGRGSFSGYGGGTLYTNMDNMVMDNITFDRKVKAVVAGVTYSYGDFGFLYAYGDFYGDADSSGQKEHVVEQDIGVDYKMAENLTLAAICVINDDKENTGSNAYFTNSNGNPTFYGTFVNYRLWARYSF